jgi:AcrR family transcriptional regulator
LIGTSHNERSGNVCYATAAVARYRDLEGQRALLSAAVWSVLADQGLTGLTVRAVAERAGCSTGLVMHAFPDKRALLSHAWTLLHERTVARADAAQRSGVAAPVEIVRQVLLQAASLTAGGRAEARVRVGFLAAALSDEHLAGLHRTGNRALLRRLRRLIADCRPDWPANRRAQQAKELVALVEGLNALAAADRRSYSGAAQRAAIEAAIAPLRAGDDQRAPEPARRWS